MISQDKLAISPTILYKVQIVDNTLLLIGTNLYSTTPVTEAPYLQQVSDYKAPNFNKYQAINHLYSTPPVTGTRL